MSPDEIWARTRDFLRFRKRDYQLTFTSASGQHVLHDLAKFCRANETCFHPNQRVSDALEGRREVWLRIQQHLNLSSDQLAQLYKARIFKPDVKEITNG